MVDMKPVVSGNIVAVGYDEAAGEMHVRFKGRPTVYVYPGVTKQTHDTVVNAVSVGAEFDRCVKKVVAKKLVRKVEPTIET